MISVYLLLDFVKYKKLVQGLLLFAEKFVTLHSLSSK